MIEIIKKLDNIDWDFLDYNSTRYPYDLNSIPWYPATFVPPIPKFLIASLSCQGDVVLDPFGGSGTTAIESLKQNRIPIYNDINPFATDIISALVAVLKYIHGNNKYLCKDKELIRVQNNVLDSKDMESFIVKNDINKDVVDWYDEKTLLELLGIINLIKHDFPEFQSREINLIRKLAVTSILKSACSQSGHFTYVTDNCKPVKKVYKNAKKLYMEKLEQICLSAEDFFIQFRLAYPNANFEDLIQKIRIKNGDARNLEWIDRHSVDLVVTSPPYLCAQDYIKTMRLTNLFFPNEKAFTKNVKKEIGSRSKRSGKSEIVVPDFYRDMNLVFDNIYRVLKPKGFFCLVMGQGKSKITSNYNIIDDLCYTLENEYDFKKIFQKNRCISNRVIRIGGVDKEDIIIFQKQ